MAAARMSDSSARSNSISRCDAIGSGRVVIRNFRSALRLLQLFRSPVTALWTANLWTPAWSVTVLSTSSSSSLTGLVSWAMLSPLNSWQNAYQGPLLSRASVSTMLSAAAGDIASAALAAFTLLFAAGLLDDGLLDPNTDMSTASATAPPIANGIVARSMLPPSCQEEEMDHRVGHGSIRQEQAVKEPLTKCGFEGDSL